MLSRWLVLSSDSVTGGQNTDDLLWKNKHGVAGQGGAWLGVARPGKAWDFLKNKVDKKTVLCKVAFDMSDNQKISTKQHAAGTSLRYQSQVIHVNRCVLYFIKENPRGIV